MTEHETQRVVLLGASNLSLGWPVLMRTACRRLQGPAHVMTAHGMGRSYLARSSFGIRSAPGILDCGLWPQLVAGDPDTPISALITDLGNDLIYGRSPGLLLQAVRDVIDRLRRLSPECPIVVTRPPMGSVKSLSEWRYRLFKMVIFPWCRLSLAEMKQVAQELDEGIQRLNDVSVVQQQTEWFGLDPIHVRRRFRESAFETFVSPWPATGLQGRDRPIPIRRPRMDQYWLAGKECRSSQPSVVEGAIRVSAW